MRRKVLKLYRRWADTYDVENNPAVALEHGLVLRLLAAKPGEKILDVGCGTGRYIPHLIRAGAQVVGIDFSRSMLRVAKRQNPDAVFRYADITKRFPFADKEFDKVLCSLVLSHIEQSGPVLKEMGRVLKDCGLIVLSTMHPDAKGQGLELVGGAFPVEDYKSNIFHTFKEFEDGFKNAGLKEAKRLVLTHGPTNKHCLTAECYKRVKGKPFTVVFTLKP